MATLTASKAFALTMTCSTLHLDIHLYRMIWYIWSFVTVKYQVHFAHANSRYPCSCFFHAYTDSSLHDAATCILFPKFVSLYVLCAHISKRGARAISFVFTSSENKRNYFNDINISMFILYISHRPYIYIYIYLIAAQLSRRV